MQTMELYEHCEDQNGTCGDIIVRVSVPSGTVLGSREEAFFAEQFEKDLRFFQLFFLLVNKSSPIKRVDLVWAKDGPAGRVGLRNIFGGALPVSRVCAEPLAGDQASDSAFCNLVNDFGRCEAATCGVSDQAAEARVRHSRKAEVYRCHFGLVEIAVPVFCEGRHIATLFNGQVLDSPPTDSGFDAARTALASSPHIDPDQLRKAYFQVPVVSEEDIRNARLVLETCADYLATNWQRLSEIIDDQRRQVRESQRDHKEFAHLMLDGAEADSAALRESMRKIGLTRYPNRVLVVKIEASEETQAPETSYELGFTAALQGVEELCEQHKNVSAAYLQRAGICVFFNDAEGRNPLAGDFYGHRLARSILNAAEARCQLRVRVGIGTAKSDWRSLVDSYHEACMALVARNDAIAIYEKPAGTFRELSAAVDDVCRLIIERKLDDAKLAATTLPVLAKRRLGEGQDHVDQQRLFFAAALESMRCAAQKLGVEDAALNRLLHDTTSQMERATLAFESQRAYLQSVEYILDEVRRLHAGKHKKLVERACRSIERSLERTPCAEPISLPATALAFGVSPGHLSRVFRQVTGVTFERFVMLKRIELAKRLLLEPLSNSSEIAERCGFSDPSYFARVFRKLAGCSPSEYAKDPFAPGKRGQPIPSPAPVRL